MDNRKVECFSVSVNHDGTKLASGGLDGNVKVWDTKSLRASGDRAGTKSSAELFSSVDKPLERPLCTASRHNGAVTCVKFSPDGRYLATGSDDKIVLIWEQDLQTQPKQFGDAEADLEHWTVRKRLVAHDNDVQDMCWSPDGSLLVTVGLDRLIIIWSGVTFERIKRYDIHQSMVKGVVFDPANKYFATASDDRSVRIFRYYRKQSENSYEFQIEQVVVEPFRKSPLTSYFRRMSWSPDGQHIAVPNATNGPVTSVAIINRGDWGADVSLIGHEAPCEVCSFAPRLFGTNEKNPADVSTIVATGGQDRTLAIWSTVASKPLVVAQNLVPDPITDICWSPTADSLYVSALDGSITCVVFDKNELGIVAGTDVNLSQLHRYGGDRESAILPETVAQLVLEEKAAPFAEKPTDVDIATPGQPVAVPVATAAKTDANGTPSAKLLAQKVTTKNGKKRVAPLLVSSSATMTLPAATTPILPLDRKKNTRISRSSYTIPRAGILAAIHGIRSRSTKNSNEVQAADEDNDNDDMAGIDALAETPGGSSTATVKRQKNKIRRITIEKRYPYAFRRVSSLPELLFTNQAAMNAKANRFYGLGFEPTKAPVEVLSSSSIEVVDDELLFEVIVKTFQVPAATSGLQSDHVTVEVRNGASWPKDEENPIDDDTRVDFQDPTIMTITSGLSETQRLLQLYYPFKIRHVVPLLDNGQAFIFLASIQGTIQLIAYPSGRNVCLPIELAETILKVQFKSSHLMVFTCSGLVYVWKLVGGKLQGVLSQVSIASVLNCKASVPARGAKRPKRAGDLPQVATLLVQSLELGDDGTPFLVLDADSTVYKYSSSLFCWTKVVDPWYFHVVDQVEPSPSTRGFLLFNSFDSFEGDVMAGLKKRYVFGETSSTLQTVMKQRYVEQQTL